MTFDVGRGLELSKWVESRINVGMITSIDPADIPDNALQDCRNARVRYDQTMRRRGHSILDPAKPTVDNVLKIATLVDNEGNSYTYRFTAARVHRRDAGAWTLLGGAMLAGTAFDRIKTVVINNQFVFANNGVGNLQLIDQVANTYAALGNAPMYRYITGFYDRVVGANRTDGGSHNVEIGWSGIGNITEWDNAVDISAGTSPLIESPDDFGDPITGVFGISNVLVVPREHSIFIGTKNPIAQSPFSFYNAVPKVGCNCPWSAAAFERGLIWFDQRTGTVWIYEVGGGVESLGRPIDNALVRNIDSPQKVFGSYNPIQNEYILCIPSVGTSLVKCWTYNFRTKAWSYDEIDNIHSADDFDLSGGGVAIDDLIGTIDSLTGTIDELSPALDIKPTRAYGMNTGDILIEDQNVDDDAGFPYTTEFKSKLFEIPEDDVIIAQIRIEYLIESDCILNLYVQKNGGDFTLVKGPKIVSTTGKTMIFKYDKQIRCRQLCWKLTVDGGQFTLKKFEIHAYVTGKSKR